MTTENLDLIENPNKDKLFDLSNEKEGQFNAETVAVLLDSKRIKVPSDAKLLCLASGVGNRERGFARGFKIPDNRITFVDKNALLLKHPKITSHPEINFVNSGIFKFLANPSDIGFFFVTLYSAEYLFDPLSAPQAFFSHLPKIMTNPAILYMNPVEITGDFATSLLDNNFHSISESVPITQGELVAKYSIQRFRKK